MGLALCMAGCTSVSLADNAGYRPLTAAPGRAADDAALAPPGGATDDSAARGPAASRRPDPSLTSNQALSDLLGSLVAQGSAARAGTPGPTPSLLTFGRSAASQPLLALKVARLAPSDGRVRPVVLFVGGQHGDEPAGAEALLALARRLVGGLDAQALQRVDVVLVPRLNPDGAASGQRDNTAGIDIEGDHLALRSPEAWALAGLIRELDPAVVVDVREYDADPPAWRSLGALATADLLLDAGVTAWQSPFITRAGAEWFLSPLAKALAAKGLKTDSYYTASIDANGRPQAWDSVAPDSGRRVASLRNAVSLLIASRALAGEYGDLPARIAVLQAAAGSILSSAAGRADDLVRLRQYVGRQVAAQACTGETVLDARPTRLERTLDMRDDRTGASRQVSLDGFATSELELQRSRPRPCGYWLSPGATRLVDSLRQLGLSLQPLDQPTSVLGSDYRPASAAADPAGDYAPVDLVDLLIDLPAGSLYLPLTQPWANLAVAALEPDTPYSDFTHGLFNSLGEVARLRALPKRVGDAASGSQSPNPAVNPSAGVPATR
jgi:hypothetical protein